MTPAPAKLTAAQWSRGEDMRRPGPRPSTPLAPTRILPPPALAPPRPADPWALWLSPLAFGKARRMTRARVYNLCQNGRIVGAVKPIRPGTTRGTIWRIPPGATVLSRRPVLSQPVRATLIPNPVTARHCVEAACDAAGVTLTEFWGHARSAPLVLARSAAAYAARQATDDSFPAIGRAMGERGHSTAHDSHRRALERLKAGEVLPECMVYRGWLVGASFREFCDAVIDGAQRRAKEGESA